MAYNFVVDKEGNHAKEIHETWPLNLRSNQNEGDAEHSGSKAPSTNKPSATKQQQQHLLQKFIDNLAKHWHKTSMVITTHLRDLRRIYKLLTCCYRGSHFARSSTEQAICDIADNTTKQFLHHGLIHETMRFLASQCAHHQAKQLQNKMHAVQHSFSRPEHFLSTQEGTYLKAAHIFRGSFFALQNSIPIGNNILCWSQHARPGLKFIPNSISLGRTYQVTASTTTDILPKNNFSYTTFSHQSVTFYMTSLSAQLGSSHLDHIDRPLHKTRKKLQSRPNQNIMIPSGSYAIQTLKMTSTLP